MSTSPSNALRKSGAKRPRKAAPPTAPKVGLVSLGCPKALVDSERIMTRLRAEGYDLVDSYDGADLVIVNTCAFLDTARDESLDAIGEAMAENGKVVVTGCLGVHENLIREIHPGVLAVTGPHQYETVMAAVHQALPPAHDPYVDLLPPQGVKLTPRHYAYLKISEGCNNKCTFCIIPSLRGPLASRPIGDVLAEAEGLAEAGVKELLVISQDTSAYGIDAKFPRQSWRGRDYRTRFLDLCEGLAELGIWTRLHYVYPYPHVDEVIPLMAAGKVLPYLDIPFQHASPSVLKAMRRPAHQERTLERIKAWRGACPDLVLRSTFIVGFPGETEDDFDFLVDWLEEAQLDRVGCFKYENVAGARAQALDGHLDEDEKQDRWERLMEVQQEISARRLARLVGRELDVLIDEAADKDGVAVGRCYADAPEIDGVVRVADGKDLRPGGMVRARITGSDEYDLRGEVVTAD
ncbi:MAG: 30S ribosomal protein S12 methylthiotransferase RimO [Rhodospirillales bacterium CG15_BIG_FIL_POST_REV_8_21_14_020_66_15]|nr:MAG: 30S ribosomal protein S12 methylthiotransferase RimO [Rhodospirillales bacterium CG15_BIG_FIL_POST_REV_8_21_14_020_66_15]